MTAPTAPAGRAGAGAAVVHHARLRSILTLSFGGVLLVGYLGLPRHGGPLPAIARHAMTMAIPRWHTTEAVNAVVYGTRAFDTVGETFLLVAAVVAVTMVSRRREPRPAAQGEEYLGAVERDALEAGPGFPELERIEQREETRNHDLDAEMNVVIRVGTHTLLPALAIAGLLVVAWGYSPGGGFPAGVALVGVALLVYASRGLGALGPFASQSVLEDIEIAASIALLGIAVGGLIASGSLTANFLPLGKVGTIQGGGVLQAFSGIEVFEVAGGLLLVIIALLTTEHDWADSQSGERS
ncbi:MAG: MnhB domain-containing protein [Acidimicrobiales bacterium]